MKRLLDVLLSGAALLLSVPVLGIVTLLVRATLGSPVIFRQLRAGLHGQGFTLYKFRTMTTAVDSDGTSAEDSDRLTTIGRLLRSMSLDELPQLFNVLKGDMSLVGPRPLLMEYLPLYSSGQARRHEVRPGITGWAQVNGRNAITWEEKFRLDVWYVDNRSFWLDLKILALTVKKVLMREGVTGQGHVTVRPFRGSDVS